ncbi:hypothetical protein AGMMS49992_17600 [Clostridia bacterium]|nr:hypothetical protein AGMMS49992_17600 [Clostridia bacterium]
MSTSLISGNGYTIRNITSALFSNMPNGATINNLKFEYGTFTITSTGNTGLILAAPGTANSNISFNNCEITQGNVTINATATIASSSIGGFVGLFAQASGYSFSFVNCINRANFNITGTQRTACYVGGILGSSTSASTTKSINSCMNTGNISFTFNTQAIANGSGGYVGGIAGNVTDCSITFCTNKGNINAAGNNTYGTKLSAGGIVGLFTSNGQALAIRNNRNEGAVTAGRTATTAGTTNADRISPDCGYAGGIAARVVRSNNSAPVLTIDGNMSAGSVSGRLGVGGLIGGFYSTSTLAASNVTIENNICCIPSPILGVARVGGLIGDVYLNATNARVTIQNNFISEAYIGATLSNTAPLVGAQASAGARIIGFTDAGNIARLLLNNNTANSDMVVSANNAVTNYTYTYASSLQSATVPTTGTGSTGYGPALAQGVNNAMVGLDTLQCPLCSGLPDGVTMSGKSVNLQPACPNANAGCTDASGEYAALMSALQEQSAALDTIITLEQQKVTYVNNSSAISTAMKNQLILSANSLINAAAEQRDELQDNYGCINEYANMPVCVEEFVSFFNSYSQVRLSMSSLFGAESGKLLSVLSRFSQVPPEDLLAINESIRQMEQIQAQISANIANASCETLEILRNAALGARYAVVLTVVSSTNASQTLANVHFTYQRDGFSATVSADGSGKLILPCMIPGTSFTLTLQPNQSLTGPAGATGATITATLSDRATLTGSNNVADGRIALAAS